MTSVMAMADIEALLGERYGFENNVGTIALPIQPVRWHRRTGALMRIKRRCAHLCGGSSHEPPPAFPHESPEVAQAPGMLEVSRVGV